VVTTASNNAVGGTQGKTGLACAALVTTHLYYRATPQALPGDNAESWELTYPKQTFGAVTGLANVTTTTTKALFSTPEPVTTETDGITVLAVGQAHSNADENVRGIERFSLLRHLDISHAAVAAAASSVFQQRTVACCYWRDARGVAVDEVSGVAFVSDRWKVDGSRCYAIFRLHYCFAFLCCSFTFCFALLFLRCSMTLLFRVAFPSFFHHTLSLCSFFLTDTRRTHALFYFCTFTCAQFTCCTRPWRRRRLIPFRYLLSMRVV
jgi:hypothetical protein